MDTAEVWVAVVIIVIMVAVAYLVASGAATIVDDMYHVLLHEKVEGTEYGGAIGWRKRLFELSQGKCLARFHELAQHEQTHGCRLYLVRGEALGELLCGDFCHWWHGVTLGCLRSIRTAKIGLLWESLSERVEKQ